MIKINPLIVITSTFWKLFN